MPGFMLPDQWALLLKHWSTDEKFKKRSEIGKMARASEKGGSLHTGGAISQITRKERMVYFLNFVKYFFSFLISTFWRLMRSYSIYVICRKKSWVGR